MSDKYPSLSPYAYVANNPIKYIDPDGRAIDVSHLYKRNDDGDLIYKRQVLAFELFAASDAGKKYLTDRAQKGFELKSEFVKEAGFVAEKAGKLSSSIDANFSIGDLSKGIGAEGDAGGEMLSNGKLSLTFRMDKGGADKIDFKTEEGGRRILENVDTWHHEVFIHGEAHEKRFNAGEYRGVVGKVYGKREEHGSTYLRNSTSYYRSNQTYYNLVNIRNKYNLNVTDNQIWYNVIFHGYKD